MKKLYQLFMVLSLILISGNLMFAQNISVSGKVTEKATGVPIPFVSIQIKGTTQGSTTLEDGTYTINAPVGATLVYSFIGYKTIEIPVQSRTLIDAQPENDALLLDEVVMVAYGSAKKESLTGAVSSVNTKDIEKRPLSSVSSVLEGQAAGVQVNNSYGEPGSDAKISIRGFTSVNGSNDPLYVLDGVPFGGNISDINPNDIESISVLKDAASSALFGNRASNGVILITTKRGKSEKINLRANINQGIYNRGMKEYEKLDVKDFMEVMWKGYRNSLVTNSQLDYPAANAEATSSLVTTYLKYNIFNKPDDQLFDSNGKMVADAQIRSGYDDLDWFKYIERLGYRQDYSISGDAATEKSSYFFSAGYLDEKGYLKASDFNRFTGRANISITPKKWLKTGVTISGSHQVTNNSTGDADNALLFINPFNYARNIAPIFPVYLHDPATGEYMLDEDGNKIYDNGGLINRPQYGDRHIVWETELNMDRTYRNTMSSQAFAEISFLKDFKFIVKGDLGLRNSERQVYSNAIIGDGAGNKGRASRTFYRYKNYTFQQQLTWDKEFGKHKVDILAGHENYSYNYAYTFGFKTTEMFGGDTELINFTSITDLTGYQVDYRTESYLTRARYNYDNKYYLEGSFRRDGSSKFNENKRWGNFWSLGGSWSISREEFMASLKDKINSLKLRASYGQVGNDMGVDNYGHMQLYRLDQNANIGALYKIQNNGSNIKWETLSSFGAAIEGRFFNRINLSVEYFDKRSKNLLFDVNLPLSSGATSTSEAVSVLTQNLGSVANRGLEVALDVDIINKDSFRWNIGLNGTRLKNTIVRLPEQNRANGIINDTKRYFEGHGIYDFWMFQFVGVDQMNGTSLYLPDLDKYYIGTPVEGKTELPSRYVSRIGETDYTTFTTYAKKDWSGTSIPDMFGSFSTKLSYKNFDLSMLFTYSIGGKIIDYSYQDLMSVSSVPSSLHKDLLNSWDGAPAGMSESSPDRIKKDGIPAINYLQSTYNNALSTRFLKDASYLSVKNIALSYQLPKNLVNKLDLSDLSVSVSIDNLATFTSLQGMNPQQSFDGINNNAFVTARVFSLGLNIKL